MTYPPSKTCMIAQKWDRKYAQTKELLYGDEPSAYLVETYTNNDPQQFEQRIAFLPGDGEGRHSRFLAKRGMRVLTCDLSPIAVSKAKLQDQIYHVHIERFVAHATRLPLPKHSIDFVAMMYLQVPPDERRAIIQQIIYILKPGGCLLVEGFHPDHVSLLKKGPGDVALTYDPEEFVSEAKPLRLKQAHVGEEDLQDGTGHQGPAFLTKMLFLKD